MINLNLKQRSIPMSMPTGFNVRVGCRGTLHVHSPRSISDATCQPLERTMQSTFLAHLIHHQMSLCYRKLEIC